MKGTKQSIEKWVHLPKIIKTHFNICYCLTVVNKVFILCSWEQKQLKEWLLWKNMVPDVWLVLFMQLKYFKALTDIVCICSCFGVYYSRLKTCFTFPKQFQFGEAYFRTCLLWLTLNLCSF